jgi:hypothetical protein
MSDYKARSRSTDPQTSHDAAYGVNRTDKVKTIIEDSVLYCLSRRYTGATAGEIAEATGHTYLDVQRVVKKTEPRLKRDGTKRPSLNDIGKLSKQQIWYAVEFLPS